MDNSLYFYYSITPFQCSVLLLVHLRSSTIQYLTVAGSNMDTWKMGWTPWMVSRRQRVTNEEDFTLPHRFLVESTGLHMELWSPPGVHVDFLCRGPSQIFSKFHLDSTPPTQHRKFHISVDSTWTPAVCMICFAGVWYKDQGTWYTKKKEKNKDILILNKLHFSLCNYITFFMNMLFADINLVLNRCILYI